MDNTYRLSWRIKYSRRKLKETGTSHWAIPNTGATNESGFTALPGGWRGYDGLFHDITYTGYWWSSTQNGSSAWERELYQGNATVSRNGSNSKFVGFSVRCKKTDFFVGLPN